MQTRQHVGLMKVVQFFSHVASASCPLFHLPTSLFCSDRKVFVSLDEKVVIDYFILVLVPTNLRQNFAFIVAFAARNMEA